MNNNLKCITSFVYLIFNSNTGVEQRLCLISALNHRIYNRVRSKTLLRRILSVDVTERVSEAKYRRGFLVTSFLFPVAAASLTRPGYTASWMIRPVAV